MIVPGLILGIALLIAGGTALVHGASQVASRLGISPKVVGLTGGAVGTSTPELVVNVLGVLRGETALAFGNVVGSNIANIALVLGASALVRPVALQSCVVQREVPLLLLASVALTVMALDVPSLGLEGIISGTESVLLLGLFGVFLTLSARSVLRSRDEEPLFAGVENSPLSVYATPGRFGWLYVAGGIVLLYVGGDVTVRFAVELATSLGLSIAIIGLLVVAVGTSMPELVTSVIAALRDESDLALGNVVGSNIFNALFVLPVSSLAGAIPVPRHGVADLLFSLALAAVLVPVFFLGEARLGRVIGSALLITYVLWALLRLA